MSNSLFNNHYERQTFPLSSQTINSTGASTVIDNVLVLGDLSESLINTKFLTSDDAAGVISHSPVPNIFDQGLNTTDPVTFGSVDTGTLTVQTVPNDDTEDKLFTWNSVTKDVEYRTVSSLPHPVRSWGQVGTDSNGTVTPIGAAGTLVKTLGVTSLIPGSAGDFDMPLDNRLRYIGTETKTFIVTVDATVNVNAGAGPFCINVSPYLNGVGGIPFGISQTCVRTSFDNQYVGSTAFTEMNTNDYLELWISNGTDTEDVRAVEFTLTAMSI